jgi:hypothetical protein
VPKQAPSGVVVMLLAELLELVGETGTKVSSWCSMLHMKRCWHLLLLAADICLTRPAGLTLSSVFVLTVLHCGHQSCKQVHQLH